MQRLLIGSTLVLAVAFAVLLGAVVTAGPERAPEPAPDETAYLAKEGDEELAYLLTKLVLRTRAIAGEHYTRGQSAVPGIDFLYKRWLAKNTILPAAVADRVFADVVPGATGGRAWVKMVVEEPRNENNRGDSIALEMLDEIRGGSPRAERSTAEAYYYAEPIEATETCLPCHGEPKGEPDPLFPEYEKNGWRAGEIVGAVISRVAPVRD
ncbi:MAG: DUF3365 domain-containing protein [Gemmatimonadota bacterium]